MEEALLKNILTCSMKRGSTIFSGYDVASARRAKIDQKTSRVKLTGASEEPLGSETLYSRKHAFVLIINKPAQM